MLPDWDFNGDEAKRGAFIAWANAELDYLCGVTTERFRSNELPPVDWVELARASLATKRPAHRPRKADAFRAADGMDAALWDYILIKYVFDRFWPGLSRPLSDPAHGARIAARRNWHELRDVLDYSEWGEIADEQAKAEAVQAAWKQWKDRPGKRMGDDDLAYLKALRDKSPSR